MIGVWTTASRQRVSVWDAAAAEQVWSGPFYQVSRLANPLINEVLIPLGRKDRRGHQLRGGLPGLPVAEYTVWLDEHTPVGTVTVHEGEAARFRRTRAPREPRSA